ncbi:MAG TPA: virulence factor [Acidimicrobiia bacterium]|nr:virulence factor [Acidimicrobiia bacterium]
MSDGEVTVIYWRDIPAQVMAGKGRNARRIPLPDRFQAAIDRAATRVGVIGADEYTAEYRKVTVPGPDPEVVADQLDADFPDVVLDGMIRNGGWHPTEDSDD